MNEEYQRLLEAGIQRFHDAQPRLKEIFKKVAKQCLSEGLLSEEQAERYLISGKQSALNIWYWYKKNYTGKIYQVQYIDQVQKIDHENSI